MPGNPIRDYFVSNTSGPGIWKWDHYFEVYKRHLAKFRNGECHLMEVGIYSGGSLGMWRNYFGEKVKIYGIDIQPDCKAYEREGTRVFIGDQADRSFWRGVKEQVQKLDVLIDDGGHSPQQQIITLEEMLPHLSPGGVYICEDVFGASNNFAAYVAGLTCQLYGVKEMKDDLRNNQHRLSASANDFQAAIGSIHHYPFITVIEKAERKFSEFIAPKRGTEWQPFLR